LVAVLVFENSSIDLKNNENMRLKSVFIRFYKSFNYNYLRKIKSESVDKKPWEYIEEKFYPFVEVPIDRKITTVVGANESGKSHLLTAIEKGMTGISDHCKNGKEISRKDFCRYSPFFKSIVGEPQLPDFGFEWVEIEENIAQIRKLCKIPEDRNFERFFLFRFGGSKIVLYLSKVDETGFDEFTISVLPETFLPNVFRIDSNIALPNSVSIDRLIKGRYQPKECWQPSGRELAFIAVDKFSKVTNFLQQVGTLDRTQNPGFNGILLPDQLQTEARTLEADLKTPTSPWRDEELLRKAMEFNLAYDLIFEIAQINVKDINMLHEALRKGESGIVRSVVNNINDALRKRLNFPRIWAQDRSFALRIEATEHELSFLISDRTGREYSFDERSSGLRHFLSYYIQYLTHKPQGHSEILLMDEPDAFLSGEAQQDLTKVFQMFAEPSVGKGSEAVPVQVIYVTHSPFLIDKNHAERVRALDKAEGSKGTRVIKGTSQNHYEPLRSAFGAFVGETTFISGSNLMVEGPADQILLAGSAAYLRKLENVPESQLLDLNRITIVPCGGASNLPYLVYLARGRDAEKPSVIVMLDSDKPGNEAVKDLSKDGPHPRKKPVLEPKFILQLGGITSSDIEIIKQGSRTAHERDGIHGSDNTSQSPFKELEDLVPLPLALRATKRFLQLVYDLPEDELKNLSEDNILSSKLDEESFFEGIQKVLCNISPEYRVTMDKVPFARTVVDLLPELARERHSKSEVGESSGLNQFEANMRALFYRLQQMQKLAEQDLKDKRMRQKVEEKIQTFLNDHAGSETATRDDAKSLLADIESDLDGDEAERTFILNTCASLKTSHSLYEDLFEPVREFSKFTEELEVLRNAREYAYANPDSSVPSLRNLKEKEDRLTNELSKDNIDEGGQSSTTDTKSSKSPKNKSMPRG
jgi:predicted ATPase